MTFRRFAVSLLSVCALLVACSDDDAIVALNVTAGADVPVVDQLHVTITQGSRKFVYDFKPPVEEGAEGAEPSIQNSFFERITLPDEFDDEDALVQVEARMAGGAPFEPALTDETTVRIEESGVVAAYVKLEFPMPEPEPEPGAAGAGGAGGEAGSTNEGGAGGGDPNRGGAPADAIAGAGG